MSAGLRTFLPVAGKLREVDVLTARRVLARGGVIRPIVVQVERERGVDRCKVDFYAIGGVYWCRVVTGQARKVAEAAVWVSAVHAFARFGAMAGPIAEA